MRHLFVFVLILLSACSRSDAAEPLIRKVHPLPAVFTEEPKPWISTGDAKVFAPAPTRVDPEVGAAVPEGPYADWASRCEPMDFARLCETDADCVAVEHPSTSKLACMKPWWSGDTKVCSPGWSDRSERQWRHDRLDLLVKEQYFGLTIAGVEHHETRQWATEQKADQLSAFLWLVYSRETTGRPWKRHRLNGDVKVARTDWARQAERYGWTAMATKHGVVKMTPCTDCETAPSPHYTASSRWAFGLGPYGQVAPLWVATWDPQAPPEVLCGEVEATEAYLRGARRVWRKLRGGIQCNGTLYQPEVTWEILHRGVAGGKLCPGKSSADFRRRAKNAGLDPDQVVTREMLGKPIDRETQNHTAEFLYAVLDTDLPAPIAQGS